MHLVNPETGERFDLQCSEVLIIKIRSIGARGDDLARFMVGARGRGFIKLELHGAAAALLPQEISQERSLWTAQTVTNAKFVTEKKIPDRPVPGGEEGQ